MRAKAEIIGDIALGRRLASTAWRDLHRSSWVENRAVLAWRAIRKGHPTVSLLSALIAAAGWINSRRAHAD